MDLKQKNPSYSFERFPRVLFFLSYFSVIFGTYIFQLVNGWMYLGNQIIDFGDLKYVLDRADCSMEIGRLVFENGHSNPVCNDYIYGYPLLKFFNYLNISGQDYVVSGIVFMIVFSLIASLFMTYSSKLSKKILIFICLFSPPITLLIQRANIDTFIWLSIILSVFLLRRDLSYVAIMIIYLISSFKFYPSTLLLYFIFFLKSNWKRITLFPLFILVLASMTYDLSKIAKLPWDAKNMFGNIIWGEYLVYAINGSNSHVNYALGTIMGIFFLALPILMILKNQRISNQLKFKAESDNLFWCKNLFYVNGIVFFSCYFMGLSVDYRLIYLAVPIYCSIELCDLKPTLRVTIIVLLICSLYASYNVGVLQVFGDAAILLLTAVLFSIFIKNFASLKSYLTASEEF